VSALTRLELAVAGIDLWIPPSHFTDEAHVDRAIAAVGDACSLLGALGGGPLTLAWPDPLPTDETIQACLAAAGRHGAVLAPVCSPPDLRPDGCVPCVDTAVWTAAGLDPIAGVADGSAAVRLTELVGGVRVPGGTGGSLDVEALRIACEIAAPARGIVADVRGLPDPASAVQAMAAVWS